LLQADGAVLMESGQLTAALNRFQEARRLRPNPDAKSFELSRSLIEIARLAGDHAAAWKEWKQLQADLKIYFRSVRRQPGEADLQAVPAFEALRDYPLAAQTMAGIVRDARTNPTPQALELHYALYKHAGLLVQLQQVKKAIPLLNESLEAFERAFGREHTACEDAILEMAKAYAGSGEGAKAETLAREACGLREKRLGRDHLWTANCRAELARILNRLGKCKEATQILTETLNTRSARLPLTHSTVWKNQVELGESVQTGNDHRAAVAALQKYRKRLAGILPDGSYQVAELESLLAESLIELGDYAGAEPLLLKAYAHQMQDIPQLCDGRPATRLRLVRLYERWGKASETSKYAQR
jgi:tetratricopeptide (TPR) repeat protein